MTKLAFMKFYIGDWIKDTRALSLEARGAWIDLLCLMWDSPDRGRITLTIKKLSRYLGTDEQETASVIQELIESRVLDAEVTHDLRQERLDFSEGDSVTPLRSRYKNVTGMLQEVTLTSRRMLREEKRINNNRLRQQKYRENVKKSKSNAKVTGRFQILDSRSPIVPLKGDGARERKEEKDKSPKKPSKLELQAGQVIKAYNSSMNKGKRPITATPANLKAIGKLLKSDPEWGDKYLEAAPLFPKIDDSEWSCGRVSWPWSLRATTVDRVISGGYKLRGSNGSARPSPRQPPDWKPEKVEAAAPEKVKGILKGALANIGRISS